MFDLDKLIGDIERAPILVGGKEYTVKVPSARELAAWDAANTVPEMAAWVADHVNGLTVKTIEGWPLAAIIACANHIIIGEQTGPAGNVSTGSPAT